jgi:hypothetical protein
MSFKWLQRNEARSSPWKNIKMVFVKLWCLIFLFYTHINTVWRTSPNPHHSATLSQTVLTSVKRTPSSPRAPRGSWSALTRYLVLHYCTHSRFDTFCLTKEWGLSFAQCLGLRQVHVLKHAHCERTKQRKRNSQRVNTCNINRASVRLGFINEIQFLQHRQHSLSRFQTR